MIGVKRLLLKMKFSESQISSFVKDNIRDISVLDNKMESITNRSDEVSTQNLENCCTKLATCSILAIVLGCVERWLALGASNLSASVLDTFTSERKETSLAFVCGVDVITRGKNECKSGQ